MLTVHSISCPADSRAFLTDFDPQSTTWIVSDLKSKLDINKWLMRSQDDLSAGFGQNRTFLHGHSVLRASELWRILLSRLRPDLQIVSREFLTTILGQKLQKTGLDWAQGPGAARAAYDYLTQLMPILSHPNGNEMLAEWFKEHPQSQARWGRWFDLSNQLWQDFLEEGLTAPTWASGVLTNESLLVEVWNRPLIIDLGAELDQVEADLIVQLAERIDITVLRPTPAWTAEYQKALSAYEIFDRKLEVTQTRPPNFAPGEPSAPEFRRYTTMIAEVKDAVATARRWLEGPDGASTASRIAIVAPDIEVYWPALSCYLEQEGLPCQKDQVRRMHTFLDISKWFAALRLKTGSFAEADLELALYAAQESETSPLAFERFKTLYATIYERDDLSRSSDIAARFAVELHANDECVRDEFVAWSLKQLPEATSYERIQNLFNRLFSECSQSVSLSTKRWLQYLENLAAKIECRVRDGDPDGISCLNLTSAENSPSTHMMVLGLTEAALKPTSGTAILYADILSLATQFGFHLSSDDQASLEFEARWVVSDPSRVLKLCVPETDFSGSIQAASWLWVRGARELKQHEKLTVPEATRWDEIQKADLPAIATIRTWSDAHAKQLARAFGEDLGEIAAEVAGRGLTTRLSPSAIEDYLECPFVFAAKRLFMLSDVSELDLEVDPSRRGSLMHKIFEILTQEPMRFELSDAELNQVLELAREQAGIEFADQKLWPPLKARHHELARRFLKSEQQARQAFPETKTLATEAEISGFLVAESGELVKNRQSPTDFIFNGRIDRIDGDQQGHLAIYDYKSSAASAKQFGSWIKNNKIQLLLYAMAIENGLSEFAARPVAGAFYYVARTLERENGFKVKDLPQALFDVSHGQKRNRLTEVEKQALYGEAKKRIQAAAQGILAGQFAPQPRDVQNCTTCQWSVICRAPHLNS